MVITLHGLEKTEIFSFQPGGFGMVGLTAPLQFRWIYLDQSKGIFGHFSKVVFVVCA